MMRWPASPTPDQTTYADLGIPGAVLLPGTAKTRLDSGCCPSLRCDDECSNAETEKGNLSRDSTGMQRCRISQLGADETRPRQGANERARKLVDLSE